MLNDSLKKIIIRDLQKLKDEINAYSNESNIWITQGGISNSAGNLCLHLVGNLNHFIGAQMGQNGFIRHRELEFSLKDIPRTELIKNIEDTIQVVDTVLDQITAEQLATEFPIQVFGFPMSTEYFLIHLASHLSYHLGQINYHRRLLDL